MALTGHHTERKRSHLSTRRQRCIVEKQRQTASNGGTDDSSARRNRWRMTGTVEPPGHAGRHSTTAGGRNPDEDSVRNDGGGRNPDVDDVQTETRCKSHRNTYFCHENRRDRRRNLSKISVSQDTSVSLGTTHQQNVGLRAAEYLYPRISAAQ